MIQPQQWLLHTNGLILVNHFMLGQGGWTLLQIAHYAPLNLIDWLQNYTHLALGIV